MSTAIRLPDTDSLESQSVAWPDRARQLAIVDDASNGQAGELLLAVKGLRKQIADTCDPVIGAAYASHKAACEQKRKLEAPLVQAETILKQSMSTYFDECQRRARAEAARLEAEAREKEESARLEEAAALEAAGDHEEAERVLVEEPPIPAFIPPPPVAKVQGVAMREEWSGEVTDMRALCAAIGAGAAPVSLVSINQATLNGLARSLKRELKYAGVKSVFRTNVAAGRR